MSPTPRTVLSSPPGQEDQSARLAASAEVDQVVDTPTLEQFQRWLEDRCNSIASEAAHPWITASDSISLEREYSISFGAKKLLVEFMLEHCA